MPLGIFPSGKSRAFMSRKENISRIKNKTKQKASMKKAFRILGS